MPKLQWFPSNLRKTHYFAVQNIESGLNFPSGKCPILQIAGEGDQMSMKARVYLQLRPKKTPTDLGVRDIEVLSESLQRGSRVRFRYRNAPKIGQIDRILPQDWMQQPAIPLEITVQFRTRA